MPFEITYMTVTIFSLMTLPILKILTVKQTLKSSAIVTFIFSVAAGVGNFGESTISHLGFGNSFYGGTSQEVSNENLFAWYMEAANTPVLVNTSTKYCNSFSSLVMTTMIAKDSVGMTRETILSSIYDNPIVHTLDEESIMVAVNIGYNINQIGNKKILKALKHDISGMTAIIYNGCMSKKEISNFERDDLYEIFLDGDFTQGFNFFDDGVHGDGLDFLFKHIYSKEFEYIYDFDFLYKQHLKDNYYEFTDSTNFFDIIELPSKIIPGAAITGEDNKPRG
jgi:hypothetical protein